MQEISTEGKGTATASLPADGRLRKLRACEACRRLKVPCHREDTASEAPCQRCVKAKRQCLVTISKRKRQRQTTSREAELEMKIDTLINSLALRSDANTVPRDGLSSIGTPMKPPDVHDPRGPPKTYSTFLQSPNIPHVSSLSTELLESNFQHSEHDSQATSPGIISGLFTQELESFQAFLQGDLYAGEAPRTAMNTDIVGGQLMDNATAKRIFDRYKTELCPHNPFVVFDPKQEADEVRRATPLLFLSIVAATCGGVRPDLQAYLTSKVTRILADRIMFRGEKSLELIQSLQVMTNFYAPPPHKDLQLNFSQLVHVAAQMALDLGLGKRLSNGKLAAPLPGRAVSCLDPDALETRRCWLVCYYNCAT